jgi:hypothetical protein
MECPGSEGYFTATRKKQRQLIQLLQGTDRTSSASKKEVDAAMK